MKTVLIILVLICPAIFAFGQSSIVGRVRDHQQDIAYATVRLLSRDSILVEGTVTDTLGEFAFSNLLPGDYLISVTMIGYSNSSSEWISLKENHVILQEIILQGSSTELDEVVIKGEKQLFDQRVDRLVINVESSITSSGNTILEVLQKSPGVVVNRQNNSIGMNGKAGVRIMINNRIVQLPQDAVIQMLDGMTASNVEKIELITTPPAEYDAEGNAGIIHIVTKENQDFGTNGSIGFTLGARWAETLGANFNLNHRNEKVAYFIDYAVLRNHNLHLLKMERQILNDGWTERVTDESHRENITTQHNLSAGLEFKLFQNTLLNILFTGYRRNWDLNAFTNNTHLAKSDSTVFATMNIHESNIWQSATGSIGFQTKVNSRSDFSLNLDYLYYENENPSQYDVNVFHEQQNTNVFSQIDLIKDTPIRFLIAKADYRYNMSPSLSWEVGIKAVTSTLDNNVLVQRGTDDVWTTDPLFTSYATLNEDIASCYVSTKWQAAKEWQINSGIRFEHTRTTISTPDQKNLVNRKYGYFFPSLIIKKVIDTEKDLWFSYSKRITRPTYNDIAPFVFFWGPNTFSAGNTALYPAIVDAITIGFRKNQWSISLQTSHSRNEITFLQPEVDSHSSDLTYRSQNLHYLKSIGVTNTYSLTIASWWELQGSLIVQYQIANTSHLLRNATLTQFGMNVSLVNQFKLPKEFAIEVSGMYQSTSLSGISAYLPLGYLNAGIQKNFGAKGILRLSIDDIFNTNNWRIKTNSPENNLNSCFSYNWHNQFVRLTYTRNLGNNKLRSLKLKSGSEEERGRVN